MPGVTNSKMLSVGGATITIKRTNDGVEYIAKDPEGNEETTLLYSRKTEHDNIPERMMI
jgi:hypothetical protein